MFKDVITPYFPYILTPVLREIVEVNVYKSWLDNPFGYSAGL